MSISKFLFIAFRPIKHAMIFAAFAMLVGCANPVIQTQGDAANMPQIAGEWKGEYSSQASGRAGTIEFDLTKGANNAQGQVFMKESLGPHSLQQPLITTYYLPLPIEFVHISETTIHGKVAPYKDLKRNVTILTNFEGKVQGNIMAGSYTATVKETNVTYTGIWKVQRQN